MRALPLPWRDPVAAFAPFAGQEGSVLLHSAVPGPQGRWSFLCVAPAEVIVDPADPFAALEALRARLPVATGTGTAEAPTPFPGGVAGWLSYEAGRHLESLPPPAADDLGTPEAAFGLYDAVIAFDHLNRRSWVTALPGAEAKAETLAAWLADTPPLPPPATAVAEARAERTAAERAAAVRAAIDYIHAGDIFQANITQRFLADLPRGVAPFDLWRRLLALSPAPFSAMASFGGAHLLSASPERFLHVDAGGQVETRPIKGTRPRGRSPAEDAALAATLSASAKDRAENLMIVDLLRNDLSRVCVPGSVRVPTLCGLETFSSVHHLVSVVEGRLSPGRTAVDLLRAAFPGGSVTGAPKIRAMEVIGELEPARRGPYCGTVFRLGADDALDSSIVIRSMVVGRSGRIALQAGGGIVAESDPAAEAEEALTKIRPLVRALSGKDPSCCG
jgi:para-aminobenzoate synthetase component 1